MKLPELLAPAGSPEALTAAVAAGADAVYLGTTLFNARMSAKNFSRGDMENALAYCHEHGVACHVAMNTLITDRQRKDALNQVEFLYQAGVDALIVADLGLAHRIHSYFPDLPLHASTQCAGHNTDAARFFRDMGFSRMVAAREMDRENLSLLCKNSPIEIEMFVHGALCVSQSGGCLLSSFLGGRSGNRGECAQPCRMCYNGKYPLSLKDLCLAGHIEEILSLGVSSLKIEGRMKSPDYVGRVTAVYRRLLDEGRNATPEEIGYLADVFSRSGFTDGYFTKKISPAMLGVRSEQNKNASAALSRQTAGGRAGDRRNPPFHAPAVPNAKAMPTNRATSARSEIARTETFLTNRTAYAETGAPAPMANPSCIAPGAGVSGARVPLPKAERLGSLPPLTEPCPAPLWSPALVPATAAENGRPNELPFPYTSARFYDPAAIPADPGAWGLDLVYLPLDRFFDAKGSPAAPGVTGVVLPPVIFDTERADVLIRLKKAAAAGARHGLVGNVGAIALCREAGLIPHGDGRLNIVSSDTMALLEPLFADLLLSPELILPQIRDIPGKKGVTVYGRAVLMTLQKPVGAPRLTDRTRTEFPILREGGRDLLINALPTYMADKKEELSRGGVFHRHFLFTVEGKKESENILEAYQKGRSTKKPVRRIK